MACRGSIFQLPLLATVKDEFLDSGPKVANCNTNITVISQQSKQQNMPKETNPKPKFFADNSILKRKNHQVLFQISQNQLQKKLFKVKLRKKQKIF